MQCYVCDWHVRIYLKSVMKYKLLILDPYHPDTVCVCVCIYIYIRKGGPRVSG